MKTMNRLGFLTTIISAVLVLATSSALAAKEKSEDELIADLASPKEGVVTAAMLKLEKQFPTSPRATTEIKKYLGDPRSAVRRKAARVLGVLHTELTEEELQKIAMLLKAADHREIMDGLIALRGLKAQALLPQITPLLQHEQPNVIRDACRTIVVLGGKEHIPLIEPLLNHPSAAVKKDANDALFALKNRS